MGVASVQPEQRGGDSEGLPRTAPGSTREGQLGPWVREKLVKLSRLQGQVYASDFMAINLPKVTSVLPYLKMC